MMKVSLLSLGVACQIGASDLNYRYIADTFILKQSKLK